MEGQGILLACEHIRRTARALRPLRRTRLHPMGQLHHHAGEHQQHGSRKGQRHGGEEFAQSEAEVLEQVQILRVAEGHDHAAQIRCKPLHDEGEAQAVFPTGNA